MSISDNFYRLNGMKLILDLQGLPENICDEINRISRSPWLTMKQKINLVDKCRKNYLAYLREKSRS